jgi:acetoin utilization deacetylase AcuC-like enzyme
MRQDRFGKLRISAEGVSQRNKFVYRACHDRGILTVATMGGGYPKDLELTSPAFQNVVQAHAQGVNNAYFLSFPAQYLLPPCTVYLDLVETVC